MVILSFPQNTSRSSSPVGNFLATKKERTRLNYLRAILLLDGYLRGWEGASRQPNLEALLKVTTVVARQFLLNLQSKNYRGGTIATIKAGLSSFYDDLIVQGYEIENPWRHPSCRLQRGSLFPSEPTKGMVTAQVNKLISNATSLRDAALMAALFGGGLRRGEVLGLEVDDVRQEGDITFLYLRKTKAGTSARQPLPQWASTAIWRWVKACKTQRLFAYSEVGLHNWFKKQLLECGLDSSFSLHSCRTTAINVLLKTHSHREVQMFSRHKSVTMVERYERRIEELESNPGLTLSFSDTKPL